MSLAKSYDSDRSWKTRKFVADYGVYIALVILLLIGAVLTPKLYAVDTIAVVMRQASQLGIVAIGQTMVLLVAGLDLSVGGIFIMTSVVVAEVGNGRNEMVIPAIATAMALGGLVGLGNGLLVTKRHVPPFVATLGMLVLVKGATQAYTRGVPSGFVPEVLGIVNRSWSFLSLPLILWSIGILRHCFVVPSRYKWKRGSQSLGLCYHNKHGILRQSCYRSLSREPSEEGCTTVSKTGFHLIAAHHLRRIAGAGADTRDRQSSDSDTRARASDPVSRSSSCLFSTIARAGDHGLRRQQVKVGQGRKRPELPSALASEQQGTLELQESHRRGNQLSLHPATA